MKENEILSLWNIFSWTKTDFLTTETDLSDPTKPQNYCV